MQYKVSNRGKKNGTSPYYEHDSMMASFANVLHIIVVSFSVQVSFELLEMILQLRQCSHLACAALQLFLQLH